MAMLAERRQRKRYNLVPRGKALYEDSNRFGTKMLEKMGWSKGKGLGANESGEKEFVRIRYKNDSNGLGFEERDDQWTQHENEFNGLLKTLTGGEPDVAENVEDDVDATPKVGFGFKQDEPPEPSVEKYQHSGESLEEKSKKSRARVHYKKFTRGKDISKYSEKDLANIFGKKSNNSSQVNSSESNTPKVQSEDETEPVDHTFGVTTINTGTSISEYFKSKMEAIKKGRVNFVQATSQDTNSMEPEEESVEKLKKKKKKETNNNSTDEIEQPAQEEVNEKSKKKKKKEKSFMVDGGLEQISQDEVQEKTKKKRKENNSELDGTTNNNPEESNEQEVQEKTKKKKKKNKDKQETSGSIDQEQSECVSEEKSKKKKRKERIEESAIEQEPESLEAEEEVKIKSKKKSKKEKQNELSETQEAEASTQTNPSQNEIKKKSKKRKKEQTTDEQMDPVEVVPLEKKLKTQDESQTSKSNDLVSTSNNIKSTNNPDSSTKSIINPNHTSTINTVQKYKINYFKAEKYYHTNLDEFIGSNVKHIIGYGLSPNLELMIVRDQKDASNIVRLYGDAYDKYSIINNCVGIGSQVKHKSRQKKKNFIKSKRKKNVFMIL